MTNSIKIKFKLYRLIYRWMIDIRIGGRIHWGDRDDKGGRILISVYLLLIELEWEIRYRGWK